MEKSYLFIIHLWSFYIDRRTHHVLLYDGSLQIMKRIRVVPPSIQATVQKCVGHPKRTGPGTSQINKRQLYFAIANPPGFLPSFVERKKISPQLKDQGTETLPMTWRLAVLLFSSGHQRDEPCRMIARMRDFAKKYSQRHPWTQK